MLETGGFLLLKCRYSERSIPNFGQGEVNNVLICFLNWTSVIPQSQMMSSDTPRAARCIVLALCEHRCVGLYIHSVALHRERRPETAMIQNMHHRA
ncbi:uncharacterized protein EKO05_0006657 [Ascochyta rabiei]|uniref:uncharacterized protein n=1 Tax=Didymella rabiei TaxID=5454 RepID=UPI002205E8BB|nr:uncharacterized protein EKO05_0006657 [Ascochyta rabiei]UPX16247.1 hypothetical protein EKO05_0006657 [Ascochyta rabiei]